MTKVQLPGISRVAEDMGLIFGMFGPQSGFVQAYHQALGVSTDTAAVLFARMVECAGRSESPEETSERVARAIFEAQQARDPWAIEFTAAVVAKDLPKWAEVHQAALDQRRGPATALAIAFDLTMGQAAERIRSIERHLTEMTPEQIVEAGVEDDHGKTFEEATAERA